MADSKNNRQKGFMKYSLLLGRILFGLVFVLSAPEHFNQETVRIAASHGVPAAGMMVPLWGVLALLGGVSVMIGYRPKRGAWMLVLFLVPVTFFIHNFWAIPDPTVAKLQQMMFMKNLTMIGAALIIAHFGSGPLSFGEYLKTLEAAQEERPEKPPLLAHS